MRQRLTSALEEFICPKCGSSLSRKVEPQKPLAAPKESPDHPICPQCKVALKRLPSQEGFEDDRQVWECEQCGYQIDFFIEP